MDSSFTLLLSGVPRCKNCSGVMPVFFLNVLIKWDVLLKPDSHETSLTLLPSRSNTIARVRRYDVIQLWMLSPVSLRNKRHR